MKEAGAEIRSLGIHGWIHTKDRTRRKAPRPSFLFILRGKSVSNSNPASQESLIAIKRENQRFSFTQILPPIEDDADNKQSI